MGSTTESVKFRTNIPITMKFPFGDAKEKHSAKFNATDYFYTVEVDGKKMNLYATAKLHEQLQGTQGFGKGAVCEITKAESEDGGNYKVWLVKLITAGTPVQPRAETGSPAAPSGQEQATAGQSAVSQPATAPQPATGFSRAADMAAEMWEACLIRARTLLLRNFGAELVTIEEQRTLATTLYIQVGRLGYWQIDETPGLVALRKLVEKVDSDPRYAEVRAKFTNLHPVPADPVEQRTLYDELRLACVAADKQAPAKPDAGRDDDGEYPTEEGLPEFEGPSSPPAEVKAPIGEEAKRGKSKASKTAKATAASGDEEQELKDVVDPIADGKLVRIRTLAREAFGDDEELKIMFVAEELGIEVSDLAMVPDKQGIALIAALKRRLDDAGAAS